MGLSADDLQELHKTDPKRVKRILANRSVSLFSSFSLGFTCQGGVDRQSISASIFPAADAPCPVQSAARSKVRKLRYIAELESKAAALQEEADGMQAEMSKLQEQSLSLSEIYPRMHSKSAIVATMLIIRTASV